MFWDYSMAKAEFLSNTHTARASLLRATDRAGIPGRLVNPDEDWVHVFPEMAWMQADTNSSQQAYVEGINS